jgi:SM-20-related protein
VIHVHDDAVPPDLMLDLVDFITQQGWIYGWHSNSKLRYSHFNQKWGYSKRKREDVEHDLPPVVMDVWKHLEATHLQGMKLFGAYANAYTYGTDGYSHRDSKHPDDRTIVLYCNLTWDKDWGGETVFIDERGDTFKAVSPRFGRIVVFPSNVLHAARTVSRDCVMLRVICAFKARAAGAGDDGQANQSGAPPDGGGGEDDTPLGSDAL